MNAMHHTGIAAYSIEGAALCLRSFCQQGARELGPQEHPDVSLHAIAVARTMSAWETNELGTVRSSLAVVIERVAQSGAEFFVCPDNTCHIALESAGPALALPGLHIAEVVADRAAALGYTKVGVLGTTYTMNGPIYRRELASRNIGFAVPNEEDRQMIDDVIDRELVKAVFSDQSREAFIRVVRDLKDNEGCDAVALVCTEIPLLLSPNESPLPTLDSTVLLAEAAFEVAVGRQPIPVWRGGIPAARL